MLILLLSGLVGIVCVLQSGALPLVISPTGGVRGWDGMSRDGRPYEAWTRIPYAKPPVGSLRFQPPQPVAKWASIMDTVGKLPPCLQVGDSTSSEDCLYLSVYRPKIAKTMLPVVFYISGNLFQSGNGGPLEMAEYMMDEDLVLVVPHYRLNGFGFMSFGNEILPGNFGLKDLVLALRWVKANIESFSGDPKSVTVTGGSSGGVSAHFFVNSPVTEDLVARAHSYSGSINHNTGLLSAAYVRNKTLDVVFSLNCHRQHDYEMLLCLRNTTDKELLNAIDENRAMDSVHYIAFGPVIEPATAKDAVITEDLSLRPSTKPWMATVNSAEYVAFLQYQSAINLAKLDNYRLDLDNFLAETIIDQVGNSLTDAELQDRVQTLATNYFPVRDPLQNFSVELAHMRQLQSSQYPAVYNVKSHRGPKWLSHYQYGGELSFVTDSATGRPFADGPGPADQSFLYFNLRSTVSYAGIDQTQGDYDMSKRLIRYLSNFSYYDDPTPLGSLKIWRQFSRKEVFRITGDGDYIGAPMFFNDIDDIFNIWNYLIGWKRT